MKESDLKTVGPLWPLYVMPKIIVACYAYFSDRAFEVAYCSENRHVLHVYDYAAKVRIDDHVFDVRPGDITFTPNGSTARYALASPGYHYCVHFQALSPDANAKNNTRLPIHLSLKPFHQMLQQRMTRISQLCTKGQSDERGKVAASASLQELLIWISMQASESVVMPANSYAIQSVLAAADLVEKELDVSRSMAEIAKKSGLSQNYLAKLFHRHFGMTISQYRLRKRMESAQYLLQTTEQPIGQIASQVGFFDAQYFNKQYRKQFGVSPLASRLQ